MDIFFGIVFAAIVIEGIITYVKTFVVKGEMQWQMLVGIAFGILVATVYRLDLFELIGMTAIIPYIGSILTGILLSRGSNYIFDLLSLVTGARDKLK